MRKEGDRPVVRIGESLHCDCKRGNSTGTIGGPLHHSVSAVGAAGLGGMAINGIGKLDVYGCSAK